MSIGRIAETRVIPVAPAVVPPRHDDVAARFGVLVRDDTSGGVGRLSSFVFMKGMGSSRALP
jgi:hypothetical protein